MKTLKPRHLAEAAKPQLRVVIASLAILVVWLCVVSS